MAFKNKLDQAIHLYFLYKKDGKKIKRGAGGKEGGRHVSEVKPKDSLELDTDGIGTDFALLSEMENVPNRKGFRGVKFNPGNSLGELSHIQAFQRGHEYRVIAHYNLVDDPTPGDGDNDGNDDEDPEVDFPTPPETEGPGP